MLLGFFHFISFFIICSYVFFLLLLCRVVSKKQFDRVDGMRADAVNVMREFVKMSQQVFFCKYSLFEHLCESVDDGILFSFQ